MKYQVVEIRKFVAGSLEGLTIEHKTWEYDNERAAILEANARIGMEGGGYGYGSPYIVVDTKIVETE